MQKTGKPINLNRLVYFSAVVDTGSFTRASDRLGVSKTVVSQQVARLEEEIGANLLIRTTRRVEPTEAGISLHERCQRILREVDDAYSELAQNTAEPRGMVRITAPNDFGHSVIAPLTAAFCDKYPSCQIDLVLTDRRIDLVSNQIDLAIRVGWLESSSLRARRIGEFAQFLVAAPSLTRQQTLSQPEDIASLPYIANTALKNPLAWDFQHETYGTRSIQVQAKLSVNTTPAALSVAREAGGLSVLPDFLVEKELASGELVCVLPDWRLPSGGIYVVYPAMRFRPPKVSAFVEMLVNKLRQNKT
ncbi:LysR family transcriptional regulator [Thalassospira australica]|uniref:LysR family transcriptional regulator n=1 Tax=Thalassospira australica TaxID=1528106 RepID=UPI00051A4D01|nr:LysR family transcriptional regulator [Thalassospira australica]